MGELKAKSFSGNRRQPTTERKKELLGTAVAKKKGAGSIRVLGMIRAFVGLGGWEKSLGWRFSSCEVSMDQEEKGLGREIICGKI